MVLVGGFGRKMAGLGERSWLVRKGGVFWGQVGRCMFPISYDWMVRVKEYSRHPFLIFYEGKRLGGFGPGWEAEALEGVWKL